METILKPIVCNVCNCTVSDNTFPSCMCDIFTKAELEELKSEMESPEECPCCGGHKEIENDLCSECKYDIYGLPY